MNCSAHIRRGNEFNGMCKSGRFFTLAETLTCSIHTVSHLLAGWLALLKCVSSWYFPLEYWLRRLRGF